MKKVLQGQNYTSKQEGKIAEILTTLGLEYKRHLWLAGLNFDFKIEGFGKTILEYNGNYWHANPVIYKKDDLIKYPNESKTAQQVWEKDKHKKEVAQRYGYRVVYIWEEESKNLKDFELGKLIVDRLENIHEDQENSKN